MVAAPARALTVRACALVGVPVVLGWLAAPAIAALVSFAVGYVFLQ